MSNQILTISLDEANERIVKALDFAKPEQLQIPGQPIAVAVVGFDGRLVSFMAMDGVMPVSIQLAQDKAYTAIISQSPTSRWENKEKTEGLDISNFNDPRFTAFAGGVLIKDPSTNQIIGAIGVSGRTSKEDEAIADHASVPF